MTWDEFAAAMDDESTGFDLDGEELTRAQKLVEVLLLCISINPKTDIDAQHDIIYIGPSSVSDCPFTLEQAKRFRALGCHFDTDTEGLAFFT